MVYLPRVYADSRQVDWPICDQLFLLTAFVNTSYTIFTAVLRTTPPPQLMFVALLRQEPPNRMGEFSRRHVRTRPDAAETCQELHQLIRDTVRLVDVLTAQAVVLEGQGWNRSTGRNRTAQRPESK